MLSNIDIKIEKELLSIFEMVGIFLNKNEYESELIIDSLQMVSIIIEIEERFMIRISQDFNEYSSLRCFRDYYELVCMHFI